MAFSLSVLFSLKVMAHLPRKTEVRSAFYKFSFFFNERYTRNNFCFVLQVGEIKIFLLKEAFHNIIFTIIFFG